MKENEVIKAIKRRRSVRRFKEQSISDEEISTIIDAGIHAPTAINEQPWFFTVVTNKEILAEITKVSKVGMAGSGVPMFEKFAANESFDVHYNAPVAVVVSGRKDAHAPLADCSAAIENMLIAAESIGIGSCWVGLSRYSFANGDILQRLNLPEGYDPLYTVALGYAENEGDLPPKKRNKDVVSYIA